MKNLIVGLIVGLVLGGIIGYLVGTNLHRNNFMRNPNLHIDEVTIDQISSFFENTSDINEIRSYCDENRMYCMYYCRDMNQDHEICEELTNTMSSWGRLPQ